MNRIKELRKAKKVTQQRLADEMHVARTTVTMWEQGTKPDIDLVPKIADFFRVSTDYLLGRSDDDSFYLVREPSATLPKRVPLFGAIAAGEPIYADGEVREYVDAPSKADYALTVQGDSMEPDYIDGDIVYIRKQEAVDDGRIAVVIVDDAATLKRVYRKKDGVSLISLNPKYAPMDFDASFGGVRILGVPVGFLRMYKEET